MNDIDPYSVPQSSVESTGDVNIALSDLRSLGIQSACIHAALAFLTILGLLMVVLGGLAADDQILAYLFGGSIAAFGWGWLLANWYVPVLGQKRGIKAYLATQMISILSAISACLVGNTVSSLRDSLTGADFFSIIGMSIFMAIIGFAISLPFTIVPGIFIGKYLKRKALHMASSN